jgi:hypothetical protein
MRIWNLFACVAVAAAVLLAGAVAQAQQLPKFPNGWTGDKNPNWNTGSFPDPIDPLTNPPIEQKLPPGFAKGGKGGFEGTTGMYLTGPKTGEQVLMPRGLTKIR